MVGGGHVHDDVMDLESPLLKEHLTHLKVAKNWSIDDGKAATVARIPTPLTCLDKGGGFLADDACTREYSELPFDLLKNFRGLSPLDGVKTVLRNTFPCLNWLQKYDVSRDLRNDLTAGLSVGFMIIPHSMACAKIAGLDPIYGLYAASFPLFTYAIFGSSRQLAVGPVALVSLLVAESLKHMVDPDADDQKREYAKLAILLAMMIGLIQTLAGILQLGTLVRFLSHSVVSGFTSGSAIIIALAQAGNFIGCHVPRSSQLHIILYNICSNLHNMHVPTVLTGLTMLIFLLVTKRIQRIFKSLQFLRTAGPLIGLIGGTLFIRLTNNYYQIKTIGEVPQGLPPFDLSFPWSHASQLLVPAFVVSGAGFMESIAIAKSLAGKNGYEIHASQELIGIGLANVVGSMFSAYPVTGSVSRSAVNNDTGARTGLAGVVSGLMVLGALLFLTPLFRDLPFTILAAIIISSVFGLLDFVEVGFLYRVSKRDCLVWALAFLGVIFFSVETGVLLAVVISLGFILHETANPHTAVLGRLPGTTVYRNILQYPDAKTTDGIVVVRIDAPIFFANIPFIKDCLRRYEGCYLAKANAVARVAKERQQLRSTPRRGGGTYDDLEAAAGCTDRPGSGRVRYVVLEMTPVSMIDSDGCQGLAEIFHEYKSRGINLAICNPNRSTMNTFHRAGFTDLIGPQWFFVHGHEAVLTCMADMKIRFPENCTKPWPPSNVSDTVPDGTPTATSHRGHPKTDPYPFGVLFPPPSPTATLAGIKDVKSASRTTNAGADARNDDDSRALTVRIPPRKGYSRRLSDVLVPFSEIESSPHVLQSEIGFGQDTTQESEALEDVHTNKSYCSYCSWVPDRQRSDDGPDVEEKEEEGGTNHMHDHDESESSHQSRQTVVDRSAAPDDGKSESEL